jgi:two-component system NtrC family sensor kinase
MKSRIGLQLILAVAAVSLTVFGLLSNFLINSQHRSLVTQMEQHAEQITETIKRSTRYAMLRNRRDDVHQIIDAIGEQEEFTKVRIFNKEGEIIYSPDRSALGTMVDKRAEACYACHEADSPLERLSTSRRTRSYTDSEGRPNLGIINPIYNEPNCSSADCHAHPTSQSVLGVLDVTMSLDKIQQQMAANRRKAILLTALAIFSTSAIILLLHQQLVGKPVRQLLQATEKVADGDLTHRIEVKRNNELGKLQTSFNEMTRGLSEAQNQLYQSDKMASVGRLAAGIAHEINNPLTGVLSFSSLLLKNATDNSELRADLEIIVRETKRCREIVKGLLDFSRQIPPR